MSDLMIDVPATHDVLAAYILGAGPDTTCQIDAHDVLCYNLGGVLPVGQTQKPARCLIAKKPVHQDDEPVYMTAFIGQSENLRALYVLVSAGDDSPVTQAAFRQVTGHDWDDTEDRLDLLTAVMFAHEVAG